jgi:hypothetical protein
MRLVHAVLGFVVGLGACTTGPHDSNRQPIGQDECVTCHLDDYQRTGLVGLMPVCSDMPPDHPGLEVDQTCANCHTQFTWCPALDIGEHPDNCFPRTGGHDMACLNCHDPSLGVSENGLNTTCSASNCHSYRGYAGRHGEVRNYDAAYQLATEHGRMNFCVSCHATGRHRPRTTDLRLDGDPNCQPLVP